LHPEDFLTLEEWHRVLAAAPTPREAAFLWLMAGCGLRVSEVATLKVDHLDDPGGYLHVVNGKAENSAHQSYSILSWRPWKPIFKDVTADTFLRTETKAISLPDRWRLELWNSLTL
jgi:integrase